MATATLSLPSEEVIRANELYTLAEAKRRLGDLGPWAWGNFSSKLQPIKIGRTKYVRSNDILAVVDSLVEGASEDS